MIRLSKSQDDVVLGFLTPPGAGAYIHHNCPVSPPHTHSKEHRNATGQPSANTVFEHCCMDGWVVGRFARVHVVMMYIGKDGVPLQQLFGFERVHLKAGGEHSTSYFVPSLS